MKVKIDIENQCINFTFDGLDPVVMHVPKMSDDTLEYAQYFGIQSNIRDCAAIARKDAGGTVTEAMRRDAVLERVEYLESGATEWDRKGPRKAPQNPTILAIAAKMGITYAEAEAEIQRRMLAELGA